MGKVRIICYCQKAYFRAKDKSRKAIRLVYFQGVIELTDDEILAALRANKTSWKAYAVIALLVVALSAAGAIALYKHFEAEKAVLVSQEQLKNTQQLADALKLSKQTAAELQKKIAEASPVIHYTVQAPTVQQAAGAVKKQIEAGTSPVNKIPADKTVVSPNTDQQKVDVYRITLEKARGGVNMLMLAGSGKGPEVGIGPAWNNRDNAVNLGYTSEKRYYGMWVRYF